VQYRQLQEVCRGSKKKKKKKKEERNYRARAKYLYNFERLYSYGLSTDDGDVFDYN
jgi:hypothetical protein